MKNRFKEYHQYSPSEFEILWKDCIFVFDSNTLLNMYRYSRDTVNAYFIVLNELKEKNQLWIPYQVGFEFYENRINVISEYEKSYDEILSIFEKAKTDLESKYKDHPFLDLRKIKEEIAQSLSGVESTIKQSKKSHPKWLDKDDVLDNLNLLFADSIGACYDDKRLNEIKEEGKKRYEKKIPPGFKDDKKPDEKKYGDLILWFQIIEMAKEKKKPIILVSGDVKEDWWLEKDGKRLMPLPKLKKEMQDKAGVDFHIYTSDRFLEKYKSGTKKIDENAIKEVRKIRELEEKRMMMHRAEVLEREKRISRHPGLIAKQHDDFSNLISFLHEIMLNVRELGINPMYFDHMDHIMHRIMKAHSKFRHDFTEPIDFEYISASLFEFQSIVQRVATSEDANPDLVMRMKDYLDRLEHKIHRLRRHT